MFRKGSISQEQRDGFGRMIKIFEKELNNNFKNFENEKDDRNLIINIKNQGKAIQAHLK